MTNEQIAKLRRLDAAATPAPWEARACSVVTPRDGFDIDGAPRPEEADLIAAARNALTRLLDEREALVEALARLESWVTCNVAADHDTENPAPDIKCLGNARRVLVKVYQ